MQYFCGSSSKNCRRNLSNLAFLTSVMPCFYFLGRSSPSSVFMLALIFFLICFISAAAVWCCIVSSGILTLFLPQGSVLASSAGDAVL